jgi:hypothetical protein
VLGNKPVIELVNEPVPVPSTVFVLSSIVGIGEVLQTTPLAVIFAPPSEVTIPPDVALLFVILVILVVVKTGAVELFSSSEHENKKNTDKVVNNNFFIIVVIKLVFSKLFNSQNNLKNITRNRIFLYFY